MQSKESSTVSYDGNQGNNEKRIIEIAENVYCAVGYALANSIMVGVDGGKVIIDTTESMAAATEIKEQFEDRKRVV